MQKIIISLLFCALTAAAVNGMNANKDVLSAQMQSMNTILTSLNMLMSDDSVHLFDDTDPRGQCFDYYIPESTRIMEKYQTDLIFCSDEANKGRDAQAILNAEKRAFYTQTNKEINEALLDCESIEDILSYLNCYREASAAEAEVLRQVSQDCGNQQNVVKIKYEEIDNKKEVCSYVATTTYTTNSNALNKQLQDCTAGLSTPPSRESTTTTAATTTTEAVTKESTTPEAIETTEATGMPTEAPTDEPTTDTEQPETEPERSPEEDINEMSQFAQARRNILKHLYRH